MSARKIILIVSSVCAVVGLVGGIAGGIGLYERHRAHELQIEACEAAFSGPPHDDGTTREILLSPACSPLSDDELAGVMERWNIRRLRQTSP